MALLFSTDPSVDSDDPVAASPTLTNGSRLSLASTTVASQSPVYVSHRAELKRIAEETFVVLKTGGFTVQTVRGDVDYDLRRKIREMRQRTRFYHPNDPKIVRWNAGSSVLAGAASPGSTSGGLGSPSSGKGGASSSSKLVDGPGPRSGPLPGQHPQRRSGTSRSSPPTYISVFPGTTIEAIRSLAELDTRIVPSWDGAAASTQGVVGRIGVLSSANATHPGGNLRGGSRGQELSLARATTLYAALITDEARKFYDLKAGASTMNGNGNGRAANAQRADPVLNTHGMIYSPDVTVFRDDMGQYVHPVDVDVITCAAVPAHTVRARYGPVPAPTNSNITANTTSNANINNLSAFLNNINLATGRQPPRPTRTQPNGRPRPDAGQIEALIQRTMRERMARILYVFSKRGVRSLVLPAFGTGTFGNSAGVVARIWAALLVGEDAPFERAFDRVVFAVLPGPACDEFERVFGAGARDEGTLGSAEEFDADEATLQDDDWQDATSEGDGDGDGDDTPNTIPGGLPVDLDGRASIRSIPMGDPNVDYEPVAPVRSNLDVYARALGLFWRRTPRDEDEATNVAPSQDESTAKDDNTDTQTDSESEKKSYRAKCEDASDEDD